MRIRIVALVVLAALIVATGATWPRAIALEDRLTWWSGAAFVTPTGGAERDAFDGMAVHEGDLVRAADEGRVTLTFRDGSLASLEPGTTVRVERALVRDGASAVALRVERGRVWSSLPRNGYAREYAVHTDVLTATAVGTAFDVIRDARGSTVMTFEGRVAGAGGQAVPSGTWQRVEAGRTTSGPTGLGRMLRFSADAGSRLIVTDPFGRSCGDVPDAGELRQIPGCVMSRGTDPVLVDLREPDAGGSFIVTIVPGPSGSATVGVAALARGVVTSRGSVTARGAGMMASRLDVATDGIDLSVSGMTALASIAAAPVRGPLMTAISPGIAVANAAPAPDPVVFPPLPEGEAVASIPVVDEPVGLPTPAPTFAFPSLPLPTIPVPPTATSTAIPASPTPTDPFAATPSSAPTSPAPTSPAPTTPAPTTSATPAPTGGTVPSSTPAPTATSTPTPTPTPTAVPTPLPTSTAPAPSPAGTVRMTNVAGTAVAGTDCPTPTTSAACATLFAETDMQPGGPDATNAVTITYRGSVTATLRVYAVAFESRTADSSPFCTATDPASAVELRITAAGSAVYPAVATDYGDLADFAAAHYDATTALIVRASGAATDAWTDGDSATFTLEVHLAAGAGNDHQGCGSSVTLAWYAAR